MKKETIEIIIPSKINEGEFLSKYKSSYKSAFLDLLLHTFLFSSSLYLSWIFKNSWLCIFTTLLMAALTNRTFVIFHDCCHESYTPNKQLNYVLSHITGMLVLTSPNWILDHHTHHLTNGNIENKQHYFFNETIIFTKNQFLSKTKIQQLIYRVYKNPLIFFSVVPIIYFGVFQQFIYIIKKYRHPTTFTQSLLRITFNHILNNILSFIYIFKLYEYGLLMHYICWISLSSALSFMIFHNQHSFNPSYVVNDTEWTKRNSGLSGSSFIQLPKYLKYFYMGIEYHHIHHMNAKIPGYNLQSFHEEVLSKSNMFDTIVKLSMADCYNNLWLVLYDEDKKKYISFEDLDNEEEKKTN